MKTWLYSVDFYMQDEPCFYYSSLIRAESESHAKELFYKTHKKAWITTVQRVCGSMKEEDDKPKMKIDILKKATVVLTEQDVKEIIAEYANQFTGFGHITVDNVKLIISSREVGPPMYPHTETYFKECQIITEEK